MYEECSGNNGIHRLELGYIRWEPVSFTEIVPEEPLRKRVSNLAKYSDFEPFEGYISETVQDMM